MVEGKCHQKNKEEVSLIIKQEMISKYSKNYLNEEIKKGELGNFMEIQLLILLEQKVNVRNDKVEQKEYEPWPGGSISCSITLHNKGLWVRFRLGHIPKLQVQSPVEAYMGGNQSMFLSYIDVSLPLCLSLSLSPSLTLKSINISLVRIFLKDK